MKRRNHRRGIPDYARLENYEHLAFAVIRHAAQELPMTRRYETTAETFPEWIQSESGAFWLGMAGVRPNQIEGAVGHILRLAAA